MRLRSALGLVLSVVAMANGLKTTTQVAGNKKPVAPTSKQTEDRFVSAVTPDLRMLDFEEDYDFNLPPKGESEEEPLEVEVSVNLRNILEVRIY
jgi:hypothetical protein